MKQEAQVDVGWVAMDPTLAGNTEFQACLRRIRSWHIPPNWSRPDWFEEIGAVAVAAACEAESRFDPLRNVALSSFVHSRVLSRALTRYRQEWAFLQRCRNPAATLREPDQSAREPAVVVGAQDDNPACGELLEAMAELRAQHRWLLRQLFWEDRTEAEIGREMEISQQAVAKRKQAVLRWLRERLNVERGREDSLFPGCKTRPSLQSLPVTAETEGRQEPSADDGTAVGTLGRRCP